MWSLPTDNGSPITAYYVFIQEVSESETTFTLENTDCDGTDPTIIAQQFCLIQKSTLIVPPFNYDGGDSIWAKVSAENVYGESP